MLSKVETSPAPAQNNNLITPLAIAGIGGFGLWQLMKYLKEEREQRETDKARQQTTAHELNIQRSKESISKIENTPFTGVNGYGKTVKEYPIQLAKQAITGFYNVVNLQSGKTLYKIKSPDKIDTTKIMRAFLSTPLNAVSVFLKSYTAYTGNNFQTDVQQLSLNDQAKVKAVINVARNKFPKGWK